ncbi:potassiumion transporter [Rhodotorula toruloides]|uniref:Potassium transport protein n=1 Tax=Rhodotorula toruloides TaxID=5286 RepID=A0A511K711_RHOTO|nr:potassiumion transporter [Rhodotorula toruloides]
MRRRVSLNRHPSTAPRLPEFLQQSSVWSRISAFSSAHLNFYRLHLLVFTFLPLIASGIFFASNGPSEENQIPYIDALFMCTSAMTVTGLNTVVLSVLTVWQQVMLFLLMTIGSTTFVSLLVIVIRRQFFRNKFEHMVANDAEARKRVNEVGEQEAARAGRSYRAFDASHRPGHTPWYSDLLPGQPYAAPSPRHSPGNSANPTRQEGDAEEHQREKERKKKKKKKRKAEKLRTDMIKRVDVPVRVNKMNVSGWLGDEKHEGQAEEGREEEALEMERVGEAKRAEEGAPAAAREAETAPELHEVFSDDDEEIDASSVAQRHDGEFVADSPRAASPGPGGRAEDGPAGHTRAIQIDASSRPDRGFRGRRSSDSVAASASRAPSAGFPRTRTLDHRHLDGITESPSPLQSPSSPIFRNRDLDFGRNRTIEFRDPSEAGDLRLRRNRTHAVDPDYPVTRRMSQSNLRDRTFTRSTTVDQAAMHTGFGGFPNPLYAAASLAKSKIPALRNAVERTATMQRTTTMLSTHSHGGTSSGGVKHEGTGNFKPVSYISFDAVVGRNSKFHGLTTAQQEELGGVEYRALTVLLRIVFAYWLGVQLLAVLVLAPWLSTSKRWAPITRESNANSTWFTFFQVWSAYSNLGMSLVDTSMIPFQRAYWLIIVQGFLILAGNTAFPVFLRLLIWMVYKVMPHRSRTRETLQFLLDHPRRCFIYLFPSHQTWFLVFMLVCLNGVDWASFLILDIGNPEIEALPTGVRVIDGLLQACAVRAAGFSIVSLSTVAPALQLLYVIMMYIAVYPIAVSIRSTNVYEEKSMGVYDEDFDDDPDTMEARFDKSHSATEYISYHARKQLAFDLWWLALAVWLICIVERHRIGSTDWPEVTIFTLIFEIVSAYGTVGLSLGNTRNNASLSGVLSTLSKLITCAVMVRGRHRGLPIAIDRAVLLPSDLEKHGDDTATTFSIDIPGREPSLRTRRTRTSISSHTAVAGGGLQPVEPLTDEDRFERSRRFSDDRQEVGNGEIATGSSPSYSKDSALDGKDSSVSTADNPPQGKTSEGPPLDRNQTGWV